GRGVTPPGRRAWVYPGRGRPGGRQEPPVRRECAPTPFAAGGREGAARRRRAFRRPCARGAVREGDRRAGGVRARAGDRRRVEERGGATGAVAAHGSNPPDG